jgi:hypothetical protein
MLCYWNSSDETRQFVVEQAISHAGNYREQDKVNKDTGPEAEKLRRWVIGHSSRAPMTHCISS